MKKVKFPNACYFCCALIKGEPMRQKAKDYKTSQTKYYICESCKEKGVRERVRPREKKAKTKLRV